MCVPAVLCAFCNHHYPVDNVYRGGRTTEDLKKKKIRSCNYSLFLKKWENKKFWVIIFNKIPVFVPEFILNLFEFDSLVHKTSGLFWNYEKHSQDVTVMSTVVPTSKNILKTKFFPSSAICKFLKKLKIQKNCVLCEFQSKIKNNYLNLCFRTPEPTIQTIWMSCRIKM